MEDGLLCRNDQDCTWLDEGLRCIDYKIDWTIARDWFNGDFASIVHRVKKKLNETFV